MANMMIVDDSPIIRRSLRDIFETMGHKVVVEAEAGREAIEVYKRHKVDLVTMDIHLPDISGIEAVRHIRELNPDAAIVMISSVEHRHKVYEAVKHGAKHYIVKPYTDVKVMEVTRAVLGVHADPTPTPTPAQADPAAAAVQPAAERSGKESGRFAKKQPEPLELAAPVLASLPYELVIKDGRVVMTIQRHLNERNIRFLYNGLQGLLYYRKAKYVLEIWEPVLHDEAVRLLIEFVSIVRGRNGTVAIVTGEPGPYTQLKAKLRDGVYRSYGDIEW